ncbi:sister chromatid cohesion factor PDS5 [Nakaseomyces bracarensis]|uniref:sister chromatid cohesion factor PDS5 n=1 Tax=Nakaseomyces bracarensis TaxID=273131 RepID=UPI003871C270
MVSQAGLTKLRFNKPVLSTLENSISTNELLNRLGNLHEELASFTQEQVDLNSLDKYRTDLINQKLLRHKDIGIRAFTACCLSDILRLYAPDAPYTDVQLTDIFKLVLSQFELLGDPDNGYYIQQNYLITKLLEYRSIVLITDLPNSEKLLLKLFEIFYDDSKNFQSKLYHVIGGILGEVVSEFDNMPLSVLKLIFNKFLTFNPNTVPKGLGIASNCGYEISLILCESYSSRMSRFLTKYYSEILYNVTNEKNGDDVYEISTKLIVTTEKLHKLVLRLWEIVPDLVLSVIGFVYHELTSENEIIRKLATRLVGKMLALNSKSNFVVAHNDTFKVWMTKIADISADVRVEWISSIPDILTARNDISNDLGHGLAKTFIDADPTVRRLSVQIFESSPTKAIWENIANISVYKSLIHLTREKNREIRDLCIHSTGKFYYNSLKEIDRDSHDSDIWKIVDSIPSVLFNLYYINDVHINQLVDEVIFTYLLPFEVDDRKRINNLLTVVSHLDKKAFSSFIAFNKRQVPCSIAMSKYVEFCELLNQPTNKEDLDLIQKYNKTIDWLSSTMADPIKVAEVLETVKEINDKRIYFLLKNCVKGNATFSTFRNSFNELVEKLSDNNLYKKYAVPIASTIVPRDISQEMKALLLRSSPIIFNISNISVFLDDSLFQSEAETDLKRRLIDEISKISPTLFKDQLKNLKDTVISIENLDSRGSQTMAVEAVKTLYKISKSVEDNFSFEDPLLMGKLQDFALSENPQLAKYATKLISLSPERETRLKSIKIKILPLEITDDTLFTAHLAVITEIFKFAPNIIEEESTNIISYLIKNILLANRNLENQQGNEWIEYDDAESLKYKTLANKLFTLKLLTNKLRSFSDDFEEDDIASSFTAKTLKLFFYMIASGGELISESSDSPPTPENYQTRLRLAAGLQILKVARVSRLNSCIKSTDIGKLVNIVEDESLDVRKRFLEELKDSISCELISIKFLPLIFFTAYEPDEELKVNTKIWVNYTCTKPSFKKGTFFERVLPRLIHAIAHHPDIVEGLQANDEETLLSLATAVDYLIFYFDSIATQENFSLLYYLSERIKNYQDISVEDDERFDSEDNTNSHDTLKPHQYIYIIGELSQMILLILKEKRSWQHNAYPGKLNLPSDLFIPFANAEDAQSTFRNFLSDRYTEKLRGNVYAKVGKLIHASHTQKQRSQKRLLETEYKDEQSPKKNKSSGTRKNVKFNKSDAEDSDDDIVYGSTRTERDISNMPVRKSSRSRKEVDYNEDE